MPEDKQRKDPEWNSRTSWELKGIGASWTIDTEKPIHPNNKHYARLNLEHQGASFVNEGFTGIVIQKGNKYDFSVFARIPEGKNGKLIIRLTGKNREIFGETSVKSISNDWKKYEAVITAKQTDANTDSRSRSSLSKFGGRTTRRHSYMPHG